MPDEQRNAATEHFGNAERLQLQQLLTLRDIETRATQPSGEAEAQPDREQGMRQLPPDKWKLVPEQTVLHDWQTKCLDIWSEKHRGTVKVATGGGKTMFALAAAETLQNEHESDLRLVIVVPTIPLMNQWREELRESNIPASHIALLGGGHKVPDNPEILVIVSVINSAREHLPALVEKRDWSGRLLLVVDECHRANAQEAKKIFEARPAYTLGLSATPEPNQDDDGIPTDKAYAASEIGKAIGPIVFEFSLKESLDAGLLTEFEVLHIGLPLDSDEAQRHGELSRKISKLGKSLQNIHKKKRSRQGFIAWCQTVVSRSGNEAEDCARFLGLTGERKRLLYGASHRFGLTLKILSSAMRDPRHRVIVFYETIKKTEDLFKAAWSAELPAVMDHSKLDRKLRESNIESFRDGSARAIINAKALVEGFNVPSADIGIIAASSGSVRQRIQSLGRMLRKTADDRHALIFVLYVKDTPDEKIYESADWETVIGAQNNRYFEWRPDNEIPLEDCSIESLVSQFHETRKPPRKYRPPCSEIDVSNLAIGDEYLGQTRGEEMHVDLAENLRRSVDDALVPTPDRKIVEKIREISGPLTKPRAVRTPCGHVICRTQGSSGGTWVFVGQLDGPEVSVDENVEKLRVKQRQGERVIAKTDGRDERYARGPGTAKSPAAGETLKMLLEWIGCQETDLETSIRDLYWDGKTGFWVEAKGERIRFDEAEAGLEFPQ